MNANSNNDSLNGEIYASSVARDVDNPRIVIRGETITNPTHTRPEKGDYISFIDYLAFTYRPDKPIEDVFPLADVLIDIFNIPTDGWYRTKSGWKGYDDHVKLDNYGDVGFGGASQKGTVHVVLDSLGCSQVSDWQLVQDWLFTTSCKITRIDIAHDDFNGEVINIAKAIEWEAEELYSKTGRPPLTHMYDDRESGKGKTFYIGSRENAKYGRIYEKGKQLGDPTSPWCRAEVEFKSKGRKITYDIISDRDQYLAGAYPAFSFLCATQSTLKTQEKAKTIVLDKAIKWARSSLGQYINLICILNNEDLTKVIEILRRPGIPKKLIPHYRKLLMEKGIDL